MNAFMRSDLVLTHAGSTSALVTSKGELSLPVPLRFERNCPPIRFGRGTAYVCRGGVLFPAPRVLLLWNREAQPFSRLLHTVC